jgi:uncharacterized protein (DUF305 family)
MNIKITLAFVGSLFLGILLGIYLSINSINNNRESIMQMMGYRTNNKTPQKSFVTTSGIDRHFIEQMIPHHEGAIEMAEIALEKSQKNEVTSLANDIVKTQSKEISKMKQWYKDWYGTDFSDINSIDRVVGRGLMHGGMMGNTPDTEYLKQAEDFDKAFIEEMIPHHQIAVMMSNMLSQGTERSEMKDLAKDIIESQTKEIKDMQNWYNAWYK